MTFLVGAGNRVPFGDCAWRRLRRNFLVEALSGLPQVLLHHWSVACKGLGRQRGHRSGVKLLLELPEFTSGSGRYGRCSPIGRFRPAIRTSSSLVFRRDAWRVGGLYLFQRLAEWAGGCRCPGNPKGGGRCKGCRSFRGGAANRSFLIQHTHARIGVEFRLHCAMR